MSTVALLILANTWNHCKCPSIDEWIMKVWSSHTTKNYLAFKNKGNLAIYNSQMNLGGIMLGEICQAQKHRYHMISLTDGI